MSKLNSIESLMDGYNPQRQLLEQTRQLVKKWEPTGLLEGMEDETKRHGMAVLLENQAGQLIQEASVTGGQNAEEWSGVALPLVRRIFGELAAQDFVSVQPMNLPSGLIFYLTSNTEQPKQVTIQMEQMYMVIHQVQVTLQAVFTEQVNSDTQLMT